MQNSLTGKEFNGLKWEIRPKMTKYPSKRWGHTATIFNKKLYIYGGNLPKAKEPIYRINCENFECEQL
jgi:hypothetical protein